MMAEKQEKDLTEEEKRVIREMIERHYGVKLGPDTPEKKAERKEFLRLWHEYQQKESPSTQTGEYTTPTE